MIYQLIEINHLKRLGIFFFVINSIELQFHRNNRKGLTQQAQALQKLLGKKNNQVIKKKDIL